MGSFAVVWRFSGALQAKAFCDMEVSWVDVVYGIGLGSLYHGLGFWWNGRGKSWPMARFVRWVLGGMALRLVGALTLIAVALKALKLQPELFLLGFGSVFVLGLIGEVGWWHRGASEKQRR